MHLFTCNARLCNLHSAAGGARDGSVDVKMLADQNVQLKEALKRLHTHSIAEKTDVSAHTRVGQHGTRSQWKVARMSLPFEQVCILTLQ